MVKWLFTLAIVVFALMWWFGKGRVKAPRPGKARNAAVPRPVEMVACAHCGLHLPLSEALEGEGGRHFCGAEHRRLGPGRPDEPGAAGRSGHARGG